MDEKRVRIDLTTHKYNIDLKEGQTLNLEISNQNNNLYLSSHPLLNTEQYNLEDINKLDQVASEKKKELEEIERLITASKEKLNQLYEQQKVIREENIINHNQVKTMSNTVTSIIDYNRDGYNRVQRVDTNDRKLSQDTDTYKNNNYKIQSSIFNILNKDSSETELSSNADEKLTTVDPHTQNNEETEEVDGSKEIEAPLNIKNSSQDDQNLEIKPDENNSDKSSDTKDLEDIARKYFPIEDDEDEY